MDPLVQAAEDALLVHPHPALRLTELVTLLTEKVDRSLTEDRLRRSLDLHPDRFRILETWQGRTPSPGIGDQTGASSGKSALGDAWVVALGDPPGPDVESRPPGLRLRESVRWFARGMDGRSVLAAGRWFAVVMEDREARRLVGRRGEREDRLAS
jgi:hypothetical protein